MNSLALPLRLLLLAGLLQSGLAPRAEARDNASKSSRKPIEFPRGGGAYGVGHIWFDREPAAQATATEELQPLSKDIDTKTPVEGVEGEEASVLDLSWNISTSAIYDTHPSKRASDRPDWHWDSEISAELAWTVSDEFTITPSAGMRWLRFASQRELNSDEPFVSLQATWRFADQWSLSLRHESFWDLAPGFGHQEFAAYTTSARLQYDTTQPGISSPLRWQYYGELVQSSTAPKAFGYVGFALGMGSAIRIVPHQLSLEVGAGISYQTYPNYRLPTGGTREGWNTHGSAALVWTPGEHARISLGLEFMHSAESGGDLRFNDLFVPLTVTFSF